MSDILTTIENSDFPVNGILSGITDEELLGAVKQNPAAARRVMAAGKAPRPTGQGSSRDELKARFHLLPKDIQAKLVKNELQLSDGALMVAKSVSGAKQIKLFQDSDVKKVGVSLLNKGQLEKDELFLVAGFSLLYGIGNGTEDTDLINTEFGLLPDKVLNGEFEFKGNGKTLIKKTSCEVFRTHKSREINDTVNHYGLGYAYGTSHKIGFYKLENPKLIEDQVQMEFNVDFSDNAPANAFLKVVLWGSRIITY